MTRYELAVYDTLTFNNQYLDLVGRIGRVSSEFDAASLAYRTTGDFDQDYAALSAEYGMTFRHASGFFVEPQVQMQATFLKSYDYDSERTMSVEADSETSLQGRAGLLVVSSQMTSPRANSMPAQMCCTSSRTVRTRSFATTTVT